MKKIFGLIFFSFIIAAGFMTINTVASAQCVPLYGGGQTCPAVNIAINKTVQNPQTNAFVDNLGVNDPKFSAEQIATFQLIVSNTGGASIGRVIIRDVFPQFVSFISGPGNFDNNTKTLTFEVTNLTPGESRTFTLQGRIVPEGQLPSNVGVACVVNQSVVTMDDGRSASDNAQLCIERKVLGGQPGVPSKEVQIFPPSKVEVIPVTGVELFSLLGFASSGLVGFVLRKKATISVYG